jgi:hypothetical protein
MPIFIDNTSLLGYMYLQNFNQIGHVLQEKGGFKWCTFNVTWLVTWWRHYDIIMTSSLLKNILYLSQSWCKFDDDWRLLRDQNSASKTCTKSMGEIKYSKFHNKSCDDIIMTSLLLKKYFVQGSMLAIGLMMICSSPESFFFYCLFVYYVTRAVRRVPISL